MTSFNMNHAAVQHLALCIINITCYTPANAEEKHLTDDMKT